MNNKRPAKNIVIFASGNGTNAVNIINYFLNKQHIARTVLIITNNPNAGIIEKAKALQVPLKILDKTALSLTDTLLPILKAVETDFIVLAGFLLKIPALIVEKYPKRIVNIHPALLPKYGGKGMYGLHIHKAVKNAGDIHTGITIHYVDNVYDNGQVVFQEKINILPADTPTSIAHKVQQLEHQYYPEIIEKLVKAL